MELSRRRFTWTLSRALAGACGARSRSSWATRPPEGPPDTSEQLHPLAVRYVQLVLALGRHGSDYVDAYFGPASLREDVEREALSIADIGRQAQEVSAALASLTEPGDPLLARRRRFVARQTAALSARARFLEGERLAFDDECEQLYDVRVPRHEEAEFARVRAEIASLLPGKGALPERFDRYRKGFVVPPERVGKLLETTMAEARRRTREHLALPESERVTLELVKNKRWGGYNRYLGDAKSHVQINTDLPTFALNTLDLAVHESYPGHHVFGVLLEQHLLKERGFFELCVYPLYTPQSLVSEGSAEYAIPLTFPDRLEYVREVIFPLAGLPPAEAERYVRIDAVRRQLSYVDNELARRYLDGELTREQARSFFIEHRLASPEATDKFLQGVEASRTYVINYNYGRDLVEAYVVRASGPGAKMEARWAAFGDLLSSQRLPADLR